MTDACPVTFMTALPGSSSLSATILGRIALRAGMKNASTTPNTKAITKTCHI